MNLFILGWNLPKELSSVALAELGQMTEVYPQLDPEWMKRYVRLQRSGY
jgi:hypothetical protein